MADIQIGARVDVCDLQGTWLGFGRYQGEVSFEEAAKAESAISVSPAQPLTDAQVEVLAVLAERIEGKATTPKILLDDGRVVFGFRCYWTEAEEDAVSP